MSSPVYKARARVAVAARRNDPQARTEASRDLAAAKIEQYIERVVAEAPPLTPAQRDRLVTLLTPTVGGGQRAS